jgi:hypothetical protein
MMVFGALGKKPQNGIGKSWLVKGIDAVPSLLHGLPIETVTHWEIGEWIYRFSAGADSVMMATGQPEDRAMQGCNPSAVLEAGAGWAWKHALPPFRCPLHFNAISSLK